MNKRIIFLGLLPLIVVIVAGSSPSAAGLARQDSLPPVPLPVWQSEVVAPGVALTDQGVPGMALDPDGRPHVVYGHNRLFHAWRDTLSWHIETIDAGVGAESGPVIAIDDAGVMTVVACREGVSLANCLTVYRRAPGGSWQTASLPVLNPFTSHPHLSLTLDSARRPQLIAAAPNFSGATSFVYAHAAPSGWVSETVTTDHDAGGQPALALDSHDRPVVVYGGIASLWLARAGTGGWQHERVAAPPGAIIVGRALALDSRDRAHIVFSDHNHVRLTYLRQTDTGWQAKELADDGSSPSLTLDDADRPHLVYLSSPEGMVYAIYESERWAMTGVPVGEFGGSSNTLLLDDTGTAHIASLSYAHSLLYATNRGGSWATELVAMQEQVGAPHALTLDAADNPYLLYYQAATAQLRWAARDSGEWATSLVAEVSPTGLELGLAMGPDGVAQIAYVDSERNQLVAGVQQAGQWSLTPLTTAGRGLHLAVGQDNRPHLILIQNDRLNYWTKDNGVWHSELISPDGDVVYFAFLALDSQGRPKVVYNREDLERLIVAVRQNAGNWATTTLPFRPFLAMALGPDDAVYGLYVTNRFEGDKPPWCFIRLNMAEQVGNDWQDAGFEETFCREDPDGRLRVDAEGRIHVLERNGGGELAYHQRDANGQWSRQSLPTLASMALALGSDGQPRVSGTLDNDLRLYRRAILWLDEHALLPAVPHPGW